MGDTYSQYFDWLDLSSAWVLVAAFLLFSSFTWQARRRFASNPMLCYIWGMFLCVLGAVIWMHSPEGFERNRGIATALIIGLGLISLNSSLGVLDRASELRERRGILLERIRIATAARDRAFAALKEANRAKMAPLRKELKMGPLYSAALRSTMRLRKLTSEAEKLGNRINLL